MDNQDDDMPIYDAPTPTPRPVLIEPRAKRSSQNGAAFRVEQYKK
jgi:hypothetical protein